MKMLMQFNVMPWTALGVDAVLRHAQDPGCDWQQIGQTTVYRPIGDRTVNTSQCSDYSL